MKRFPTSLLLPILMLGAAVTLDAGAQLSLDAVLERMAASGREFQSVETDIERTKVVVIVDDHSTDSGKFYFEAKGDDSRIRMSITEPARQELLVDEGKAQLFNPRTNVVQEFDLGENPQVVQFLALGFGPSAVDLTTDFEASLAGEEPVDGKSTAILDLTPRSDRILGMFSSFRLWIDQTRWVPVQARLNEAGGDYQIVRYTNIKTNKRISGSKFDLKLPKNVQIIRP